MRRAGLAALGLGAAALTACSPDAGDSSGSADFCATVVPQVRTFMASQGEVDGQRYGGTVVVGGIAELTGGLNSLVSSDDVSAQHQAFVNQMTLVQYDENLEPTPYLARSWELSETDDELTFHLRRDVYWHDGVLTTAFDVEFTFRTALDPETGFPNPGFWTNYEQVAEVVDSFTIKFTLRPHAGYLDPWRATAIMPMHLLEDVPPDELRRHPYGTECSVGNGPFRLVEHRGGDRWVFEANPGFPGGLGGRPYVDRYVFRVIPEQSTLLAELLAGGVDVLIAPRPDQAGQILDSEHLRLIRYPYRNYTFVGWNTRRPQLADARVRRAITMATDRRDIVDGLLGGYATVANSGVPPFHWAHDGSLKDSIPYDPEGARAQLAESGWIDRNGDGVRESADGVPLRLSLKVHSANKSRQDIAEVMQAQLALVGISIELEVLEYTTLASLLQTPGTRDFDGVIWSWITEFTADDTPILHSSALEQPFGWAGVADAEIDRLLDTLPLVIDRDAALPLWYAYQRRVLAVHPYTYLYYPQRLDGVNRRLQDVRMDVRGEWVNIKDWWIPEDQRRFQGGTGGP